MRGLIDLRNSMKCNHYRLHVPCYSCISNSPHPRVSFDGLTSSRLRLHRVFSVEGRMLVSKCEEAEGVLPEPQAKLQAKGIPLAISSALAAMTRKNCSIESDGWQPHCVISFNSDTDTGGAATRYDSSPSATGTSPSCIFACCVATSWHS